MLLPQQATLCVCAIIPEFSPENFADYFSISATLEIEEYATSRMNHAKISTIGISMPEERDFRQVTEKERMILKGGI
jgi:hypothetical protein